MSIKYKLIFIPDAQEELNHAAHWYEESRKGLGTEFLNSIEAVTEAIKRTPMLFSVVHKDIRRGLVKRFPYAIYFRYEEDVIQVLSVFHTRRNLTKLKSKL